MPLIAARPDYDQTCNFVVSRREGIKASGQMFAYGETFNKALVSERTLRQLYEQRALAIGALEAPKRTSHKAERGQRVRKTKPDGRSA